MPYIAGSLSPFRALIINITSACLKIILKKNDYPGGSQSPKALKLPSYGLALGLCDNSDNVIIVKAI